MASPIIDIISLDFPWTTADPFLFCVHHQDNYPKGNDQLGPAVSLEGRNIGQDFIVKDGWRMYHGSKVPGFPPHPHTGFETVTIVTQGYIDHSDSLGATARFGNGDVQWITTGKGLQHSEMFPLLNKDENNPLELFQIWLNLPAKTKEADPYFGMLWYEDIPWLNYEDEQGRGTDVRVIAGELDGTSPLAPPPDSWAAERDNGVAIWLIDMQPEAEWTLPAGLEGLNRTLYYFEGDGLQVEGETIPSYRGVKLTSDAEVSLQNGNKKARMLLLQGRPIAEPVVQHGPFVATSREQMQQMIQRYQQTEFGGWPWPEAEHTHERNKGRFAIYVDGSKEEKD